MKSSGLTHRWFLLKRHKELEFHNLQGSFSKAPQIEALKKGELLNRTRNWTLIYGLTVSFRNTEEEYHAKYTKNASEMFMCIEPRGINLIKYRF